MIGTGLIERSRTRLPELYLAGTKVTSTAAELNLLDLASLTAGEVLVATGAAAAAWQSTGVKLSAPDISGAVTAASTLTMPALTLGGTLTTNGQVFDAGAVNAEIDTTGARYGLLIKATTSGSYGPRITGEYADSGTATAGDSVLEILGKGRDGGGGAQDYGAIHFRIEDPTADHEDGNIEFWTQLDSGYNKAANLSSAGVLDVDATSGLGAATVGLYDEFDDAIILKQGISEKQLGILEKIGVMKQKNTGSGWMLNVQAMCYLLAGGIYQNRARIDSNLGKLDERLSKLELALPIGRN